jgi:ribosomal subunit interface protein
MDILVHSEGFTLFDKLKEQVEDKVARIEMHDQRVIRARVTLKRLSAHPSPKQFAAAVLLEVPGNDLRAEQQAGSPLEAVDLVLEKVDHQLSRKKTEKLAKRNHRKPRELDIEGVAEVEVPA